VVDVDVIGAEPPQTRLARSHEVPARLADIVQSRTRTHVHLGRYEHVVATGSERFAEQFLGPPAAVPVGCVEQVDAGLEREIDLPRASSIWISPTTAVPPPPKPIVPSERLDTRNPVFPRNRVSMLSCSSLRVRAGHCPSTDRTA
jgi:hypothetical protein